MADRFAALAGYADDDESGTDFNSTRAGAPAGGLTTMLDASNDSLLVPVAATKAAAAAAPQRAAQPPRPLSPRQNNARSLGAQAAAPAANSMPPPATPNTAGNAPRGGDAPSTRRKAEHRRLQGIRILAGEDEAAAAAAAATAAAIAADDDDLMSEDSDVELARMQADMSRAADTTAGNGDESAMVGLRAQKARMAAGISLKGNEERTRALQAENNELKLEVDLLRKRYTHNDALRELAIVVKERASLQHQLQMLSNLANKTMEEAKVQKRIVKKLGSDTVDGLREAAQSARADAQAERERAEALRRELASARKNEQGSEQQEAEIKALRDELEGIKLDHKDELFELQKEKEDLEDRVDALNAAERERDAAEDQIAALKEDLAALREENEQMSAQMDQLEDVKATLTEELDKRQTHVQELLASEEALQAELEVGRQRLELQSEERGALAEDLERQLRHAEDSITERLQQQINALRDELSEANVHLQDRENRVDDLELNAQELNAQIEQAESEIKSLEEALNDKTEACEMAYREGDELEAARNELEAKLNEANAALETLDQEMEDRHREVEQTNAEIRDLSERNQQLEEQVDELNAELQHVNDRLSATEEKFIEETQLLSRKNAALRDRLADADAALADAHAQGDATQHDIEDALKEASSLGRRVDQLKQELDDVHADKDRLEAKLEDVLSDLRDEEQLREKAEDDAAARLEEAEKKYRGIIEDKEEDIATLKQDLASSAAALQARHVDLERLQDALRTKESESRRLGQSHTDQHQSLELEIERLKRDLARCEADLERARKDLERKDDTLREREEKLERITAEHRSVADKLASESSARQGLQDKLTAQLKAAEGKLVELEQVRAELARLERERDAGDRSLALDQEKTRKQLVESNNLLMEVYTDLNKAITAERATPRKSVAEPKPFSNFVVFQDSLVRLVARVLTFKSQFAERAKAIEEKFGDATQTLKRQQEARFRQLEKLEATVAGMAGKQAGWRERVKLKTDELNAVKATKAELEAQLASLRMRAALSSPGEGNKHAATATRVAGLERRLQQAQTQATQADERFADARDKLNQAEGKWALRIKELEARCRHAEERYKLERQGAKERLVEMNEMKKKLEKDLEAANRRKVTVAHVADNLARVA